MCGIAGIITWAQPTADSGTLLDRGPLLDRMLRSMIRRGPDHQAHRAIGGADLGSCRLAIQDRSVSGHQPMLNETGTVAVVFNGEIYNAPALRDQLVEAGHRFRGRSDTEVLVHGYEEWGIDGRGDPRVSRVGLRAVRYVRVRRHRETAALVRAHGDR